MPIPKDILALPAEVYPISCLFIHLFRNPCLLHAIIHSCMQASMLVFIYSHTDLCEHTCKLICLLGFEKGAHGAQAGLEIPALPRLPLLWSGAVAGSACSVIALVPHLKCLQRPGNLKLYATLLPLRPGVTGMREHYSPGL